MKESVRAPIPPQRIRIIRKHRAFPGRLFRPWLTDWLSILPKKVDEWWVFNQQLNVHHNEEEEQEWKPGSLILHEQRGPNSSHRKGQQNLPRNGYQRSTLLLGTSQNILSPLRRPNIRWSHLKQYNWRKDWEGIHNQIPTHECNEMDVIEVVDKVNNPAIPAMTACYHRACESKQFLYPQNWSGVIEVQLKYSQAIKFCLQFQIWWYWIQPEN